MNMRRAMCRTVVLLLLGTASCTSPEGQRRRGGSAGADIGTRPSVVLIHEGAQPYHDNPCAMRPKECTGPMPVFGSTRDRPD